MSSPTIILGILTLAAPLEDELGVAPVALDIDDLGRLVLFGRTDRDTVLLRLEDGGAPAEGVRRLSGSAAGLAVDRLTGNIAVLGNGEVTVLDPDLQRVWRSRLPRVDHHGSRLVAVGERGTVAVVAGSELRTYSPKGDAIASSDAGDGSFVAVAVLDGEDRVALTGWRESPGCDEPLLLVFDHGGALRWSAYGDHDTARCADDGASARGVDVARGAAGGLYFLAMVEGEDDDARSFAFAPTVGFDATTVAGDSQPAQRAYFARLGPTGEHVASQWFMLPADGSVVQPRDIAADAAGNVHITGTATHDLVIDEAADEPVNVEPVGERIGFYQVVQADFQGRLRWQSIELDANAASGPALALGNERVFVMTETPHAGPTVLTFPIDPENDIDGGGKRPDRDDIGTFGYESGVAGSDPTCYCDATRPRWPTALAGVCLVLVALGYRRRSFQS